MLHFNNPYVYLLSHLRLAVAKKNFFFRLTLNPESLRLLTLLVNLRLVRRFSKMQGTTYRIFPNYSKYGNPVKNLKTYYRLRNPILVKLRSLVLINKSLGASSIILETSGGVMTQKEAFRRKLGGILVCIIL